MAGGSAARSDPVEVGDKIGRLRLDLELAYNSVAGCSTDDSVDAHGSEHGTVSLVGCRWVGVGWVWFGWVGLGCIGLGSSGDNCFGGGGGGGDVVVFIC